MSFAPSYLGSKLHPDHTLSSWVVSAENVEAYKTLHHFVSEGDCACKFVYISGGGGSGKTHLAQAVVAEYVGANLSDHALSITGKDAREEYRRHHKQNLDLRRGGFYNRLLIDGIGACLGNERRQKFVEAWVFDEIRMEKLVVLTGPMSWRDLDLAFPSLVPDIEIALPMPSPALRLEILGRWTRSQNFELNDELLIYLCAETMRRGMSLKEAHEIVIRTMAFIVLAERPMVRETIDEAFNFVNEE